MMPTYVSYSERIMMNLLFFFPKTDNLKFEILNEEYTVFIFLKKWRGYLISL